MVTDTRSPEACARRVVGSVRCIEEPRGDPDKGGLLSTHYQRLREVVKPDKVSILSQGRIVRTGGPELAVELENEGYDAIMSAETAHA